MANRFLDAHAEGRGTLSPAQERLLTTYPPAILRKYRAELKILGAIPRLSKQQAWKLIHAITSDLSGGTA